ncbi:E3 ubiquitin-protein ligase RNF216 [Solenopsis invicta]|uniref:E3 ubiquitin-protein ligase RNF216 n=1 Tax=Solenopsis invicta TaxID=13686 RepID=UPI0001FEEE5A|nr:E3 ubiquitin-protein ligase RNF216 [Solenopsis invicta]
MYTVANNIQRKQGITKNTDKNIKINMKEKRPKLLLEDVNHNEIILNEKAASMYFKLIPMFTSIKTHYIKSLCHTHVKDEPNQRPDELLDTLIEMLLNCDKQYLNDVEPIRQIEKEPNPAYDINEKYKDLLMIFPQADPAYLRNKVEEMYNDEQFNTFVQAKLENPDFPTKQQYLEKKKVTEQQTQYTTDFKVENFLKIFPDPFSHFENDKRICQFNLDAADFLKNHYNTLKVNTLMTAYRQHNHNLSLTAKAVEALSPNLKSKRKYNKNLDVPENIPILQECAFIQHKTEIKNYLAKIKAIEEEEFEKLKTQNELLECQCCYDNECMPSKCSTCEDGHVFCNSCIIQSVDVTLGDGKTRINCLLHCDSEFPMSVLQRVLPPTKFSILLCKQQEAEVEAAGIEGLVSCPFCHFASIPPPEDKIFKCLNPECMKESCRLCKKLNHIPRKCESEIEKKSEAARLYLEEKMTEALVRKCYRCNRIFYKEEGCNKMECICGAKMCYICNKPVTDYKHFQGQGAEPSNLCPLWSDNKRMNAKSVIKVCRETVNQMKEKDPDIDINIDAFLPKLPPKSKGPHENIANPRMPNRNARP